ncbi:nuclear transport factor 2 family protein [Levilactobacillus humaensis]|uniref:nuclear transport factor 2 family protein n=1 Tax=Levilactobacillus humaensis TaxID=2950375 RepID=UPI0021C3B93F|nr:nuclear transport factor 2 family protein [Levilactobacillus humaensis]
MDQNVATIKRYFELSDLASHDSQALSDIVGLFSSKAVVEGANGFIADNPTKVATFFDHFFKDNQDLRHLCQVITGSAANYTAEWAVAGRKKSGQLFALHGFDTYRFDQNHRICFLQVEISH